jgi:hypothetical protein
MNHEIDILECHCSRLGHVVTFSYCRHEAGELPCSRIRDCWRLVIPVETCLKDELSSEQWHDLTDHKPVDKMIHLVDLIRKAQEAQD